MSAFLSNPFSVLQILSFCELFHPQNFTDPLYAPTLKYRMVLLTPDLHERSPEDMVRRDL
jgi:hypothetical protein